MVGSFVNITRLCNGTQLYIRDLMSLLYSFAVHNDGLVYREKVSQVIDSNLYRPVLIVDFRVRSSIIRRIRRRQQ